MARLADIRDQLATAIAPALPGRTSPYPPTAAGFPAPYVWVGDHGGRPDVIGDRTRIHVFVFPVFVAYDGADRAQCAGVDDIIARIIDAVASVPFAVYDGHDPEPVDPAANRRVTRVNVAVTVPAATLCPPAPVTESIIPPTPVEV